MPQIQVAQETSQSLSPAPTISVAEGVVSCNLDGEAVILHVPSGVYFGLDEIGVEIWNRLQEPTSIDTLCDHLIAIYDVTFEQCHSAVQKLLAQLQEHGLIVIR